MIPPAVNPGLHERSRHFYQLVHIGNLLRVPDDGHTPPLPQVWIQLISLERHDEILGGGGQLAPPATRITTWSRNNRKFTGCTAGRSSSVKPGGPPDRFPMDSDVACG